MIVMLRATNEFVRVFHISNNQYMELGGRWRALIREEFEIIDMEN